VSIISEDRGGTHSDSIISTEPFLRGIGMPYLVTTPDLVYQDLFRAFELSEKMSLPYGLLIDVDSVRSQVDKDPVPEFISQLSEKKYTRNVQQHVLAPLFNPFQRTVYEYKMSGLDWKSIPVPPLPMIPESTPANWKKIVETYVPFFRVFKNYRGDVVTGDTGVSSQFCSEPWHCIDIVTYMGGSISLALGAYLSGHRNVWAVTGDFSFISAGHLGLMEAKLRGIPLKVVILYNGKASTTGGQTIPDGSLETVLEGYREFIRVIDDPTDEQNLEKTLKNAADSQKMEIIIADFRIFF
jgi:TPP-dependent indolepyruvate ferredoxin oxidoreductase alpha subunit